MTPLHRAYVVAAVLGAVLALITARPGRRLVASLLAAILGIALPPILGLPGAAALVGLIVALLVWGRAS